MYGTGTQMLYSGIESLACRGKVKLKETRFLSASRTNALRNRGLGSDLHDEIVITSVVVTRPMPIDLMSLVEGGAATPGKRPSGSGNLFANKELMAQFEKKAEPDKPLEPQVPRKKWTPPPKPETEYQKAAQANEGRMPWDPPKRQSSWEQKSAAAPTSPAPKIVVNAPASPTPKISAKANEPSGKEGEESPKSRLSDNPFMRRDSKEGMSPGPRSPAKKEEAYPVISTVERAVVEKPSPEKVTLTLTLTLSLNPTLALALAVSEKPSPRSDASRAVLSPALPNTLRHPSTALPPSPPPPRPPPLPPHSVARLPGAPFGWMASPVHRLHYP